MGGVSAAKLPIAPNRPQLFCGFAIADEFHQTFSPGRSPQTKDMLLDTLGAMIAIGFILWRRAATKLRWTIDMPMAITQFLHVALLVTDLERAQQFYGEVLGLLPYERPFNFPGAWYQVGDMQVHLIAAEGVPTELVNPHKWGRNRHVAFAVTDLEVMKAQLQTAGYSWQASASGRAAVFIQDPDGNMIELSQLPV